MKQLDSFSDRNCVKSLNNEKNPLLQTFHTTSYKKWTSGEQILKITFPNQHIPASGSTSKSEAPFLPIGRRHAGHRGSRRWHSLCGWIAWESKRLCYSYTQIKLLEYKQSRLLNVCMHIRRSELYVSSMFPNNTFLILSGVCLLKFNKNF